MYNSKVNIVILFIATTIRHLKADIFTGDILEINYNITSKDIIDMEWKITHPSRGVSALDAVVDFKNDIDTDRIETEIKIYYSSNGITFILTPFHSPKRSLTSLINWGYKEYVMNTTLQCCKNSLEFDDIFESPLTKRVIECFNCPYPVFNFPSTMQVGYYKQYIYFTGDIELTIMFILKLEEE